MNGEGSAKVGCLTPLLTATAFATGAGTLFLSVAALGDPQAHVSDQVWGGTGLVVAVATAIACVGSTWFLFAGQRQMLRVALFAATGATATSFALVLIGFGMVAEAHHRGGDWGGLAIAVAWLFGVFFSLFVALVNATFAARLFQLARAATTPPVDAPA